MKSPDAAYAGMRSIARNAVFLTSTQAIKIIARFIYVIVVARLLGPELYALLAYSQSWYLTFLPLAVFGLGPVVIRSIARRRDDVNPIAASAMLVQGATTLLAAVLCVGVARIFAPEPEIFELILVLCFALVARSVYLWAETLFIAVEQTQNLLRMEAAFRTIEVLAAATILASGGGIILLVASHGIIWALQAVFAIWFIAKKNIVRFGVAPEWRRCWLLMSTALPFFVSTLTVAWRAQGPIILYGGLTADNASLGRFALGLQMLFIAALLPQSLAAAAQPVVSRSAQREDGKDLIYARTLLRGAFLFGSLASLCGFAAGPWLMTRLFGAEFSMQGHFFGYLLLILIPITAGCAYPVLIIARGHFYPQLFAGLAGALAMTVLIPVLEPLYGALGILGAIALSYIAPWIITSAYALSSGWDNPFALCLKPAAVSALTFALYFFIAPFSAGIALGAALLTLIAGFALLGIVTDKEKRFLIAYLRGD